MTDKPPLPDPLDDGLAEAFGKDAVRQPSPSVLGALQARVGSSLGVHIDSPGLDDVPVKVTEAAKALRDPSGRYQILGEIGRGGVGVVHKGRDQDLGRDVAMKVLRDDYADHPEVLARFVEEAQIGGQLQHPGIVPVYELGLQSGERPYFAMKLVKGETLSAQLARRGDPSQERRRHYSVFEQICQTMAYAHSRRVVHRDLKPSNVMIGAFGEVQVVDWGFAKVLEKGGNADERMSARKDSAMSVISTVRSEPGSGTQSVVGSMLGTPAYMPPEQALGDVERLDERSDVFGLGAILCEILTGEPPYREQDGDVVRQAAAGNLDATYERIRDSGADAAMIELCVESLARARQARPASAQEVAERVSEYLTSVEERAQKAEVRAAEARYRHRTTLLGAAAAVLLLVLGTGTWLWLDAEARARHDHVMERVAASQSAASGARGQAQAARLDLNLWAAAVASAEQVVALCEDEAVDRDAHSNATALLTTVRREQQAATAEAERLARDATMRERLEVLRIPVDDDIFSEAYRVREQRRLDTQYAQAFAEYLDGESLFGQEIGTVLAALQRGDIEVELASALDHWGLVRDEQRTEPDSGDAETARIRALAIQLDSEDPWRARLRSLLPDAASEGPRLLALTERADFTAMHATAFRVLAKALWRAGEHDAAVAVLRRGQQQHPGDFDLCFTLAVTLETLAGPRTEEGVATYRIANALRPDQNEVLHRQGLMFLRLERNDQAEQLFRILIGRDRGNGHWHFHLGVALREQNKRDEAIASYRRALELNPEDALSHNHLGVALAAQGKRDEAIASYRRALALNRDDADIHYNLGNSLRAQGQLDEAIASQRRAIELDPDHALAHNNLGNALREAGQLDEAIASFRRAIALSPDRGVYHNNLGHAFSDQGKHGEAIASYRRALALQPGDALDHNRLGRALAAQGQLDEAIASQRRAIELDPELAVAHSNLGSALRDQGRPGEAIPSFRRAIELDPERVLTHVLLGIAFRDEGNHDEAVASFRRALEVDPRDAQAHKGLGITLALQGEHDAAIRSLQRAIGLEPGRGDIHFNLGGSYEARGEVAEAIASYERALRFFSPRRDSFSVTWAGVAKQRIQALRNAPAYQAIVRGAAEGASAQEIAAAAAFAYRQRNYVGSARTYARAFAAFPGLLDEADYAYDAACAAVLASASQGAGGLLDVERDELRREAHDWLARDLKRWVFADGAGARKADALRRLRWCQQDGDLAGVRDEQALVALPAEEAAQWRAFWRNVAVELQKWEGAK